MNLPTDVFEHVVMSYLPFDTIYELSINNPRLYGAMKCVLKERVLSGNLEVFEVLANHKNNNQIDIAAKIIRSEHLSKYIDYGVENNYVGLLSGLVEKFDCIDDINRKRRVVSCELISDIVGYQPKNIEKCANIFILDGFFINLDEAFLRSMLSRVISSYGIDRAIDIAMRHYKIKERDNIDSYARELLHAMSLYRDYHDNRILSTALVENKYPILSILDSDRSHQDCIYAIGQIFGNHVNFRRTCTDEHRHNIVKILRMG